MKIKLLVVSLALLPLVGCAVPYVDSYETRYTTGGVYSSVPSNSSITFIENRPVPYYGYQRFPDYRGGYYYRKDDRPNRPHFNDNNHGNNWNNNRWDNKRDYDKRLDRNNSNFNDRFDRTKPNPNYRPPVQLSPKPNVPNCNRQNCGPVKR